MISELAGFTLSRTVPQHVLYGVVTNAYKICGGVIRNPSGQIVAHLINAGSSLAAAPAIPLAGPAGLVLNAVNSFQLYKIGKDVKAIEAATSQLISLAQGTIALSGLTLAVSSAGFVFLARKLNQIDQKLNEIAKDVKAIKTFLQSQEKAALATALKTLSGIHSGLEDKTRIPLLINARQTLGEIHQRYRDQLLAVDRIENVFAIEEYYTVTALGHALCSAELDMRDTAVSDLDDAHATWTAAARRIGCDLALGKDPERFLLSAYSASIRTEEIVDWLDFAHGTEKGIAWVDDLRAQMSPFRLPQLKPSTTDTTGIDVLRKFASRNRVYEGYALQYRYLEANGIRPSIMQQFVESLPASDRLGDCFLFVANESDRGADAA
ncbi:hypothetical protein [Noviherbaspirillum aridicola]|uniref:Uncharacterized protein n=1 Tax=Noviherbaspirillum aridicola TaxID=2849687 RepID=A0ABQ4Q1S6_9BURK|nr:hypothetical protein [Noviherbaspirillum aridicola]GIZ51105.1 hypothetical protein NCCP691_11190 [Noviherbaspirillum aridicola]